MSKSLETPQDFTGIGWNYIDRALAQLDPLETESGIPEYDFSRVFELLTDDERGWVMLNPYHLAEMKPEDLVAMGLPIREVNLVRQVMGRAKEIYWSDEGQ